MFPSNSFIPLDQNHSTFPSSGHHSTVTAMDCSPDHDVISTKEAEQWVKEARHLLSLYGISLSTEAEQSIRTSGYPMYDLSWIQFIPVLRPYAIGEQFNTFAKYVAQHRDQMLQYESLGTKMQESYSHVREATDPKHYVFLALLYKIIRWSPD